MNCWLSKPVTGQAFGLVLALWACSTFLFSCGIFTLFPSDDIFTDMLVCACILFSQFFSLQNFRRRPIGQRALVVASLGFWSVGFFARRYGMIDDRQYGLVIMFFLALVVFNVTRKIQ